MAGVNLLEKSVKLRDNLVQSLRGTGLGIEPHVIKEFVASTNNYLNDVANTCDRAEKMCGKTLVDEELKTGLLKTFNDYIGSINSIIESGLVHVYNVVYERFETAKVDKEALTEVLKATQGELNEYQKISFHAAEQKARSAGTLVEKNMYLN